MPNQLSAFISGGGEMGAKIRAFDWRSTELGPLETWPATLNVIVEMALASRFPMCINWGADLIAIYNDGYRPLLGNKPSALGQPFHETWAEAWDNVKPIIDKALAGEASFFENYLIPIRRKHHIEDAWFTFCYSPLRDEAGKVVGMLNTVVETTEQVLLERASAETSKRFVKLFHHSPSFLAALEGPTHVFTYTNPNYLKLIGHRDVIGRTVAEALPDAAAQGYVDILDRVFATGKPFVAKAAPYAMQVTPEGPIDQRLVDLVFQPVIESDGRVSGILAEGSDVTEREAALTELEMSRQQLERIADAIPQQVWIARPDGDLIYVNTSTRDYAGDIQVNDGIVNWAALIHPDDLPLSLQLWQAAIETGQLFEVQHRIRDRHGAYYWHLTRALPMRDASGKVQRWYGTNTDIEGEKRFAQEIQDARQYLELMLDSAREFAIMSFSADRKIVSWSPGAEFIFGYSSDEAIGQPADILFTPEDRANNVPDFEFGRAKTDGRAPDERWHIRKNGDRFFASGVTSSMGADRFEGFVKIARDATIQKMAEETVVAARNSAEAANIAKSEFLANMSHEIRTPMNAIIGLSNLLAMSKPLTAKQAEFIKTLQMSSNSLLGLINDLLDVAKIEANTTELEQVPFNLTQIIHQVSSMMSVRVQEKGLKFTSEGECVKDQIFLGDPTRIRQIVLNLCSNSIKFTHRGSIDVSINCHSGDTAATEIVCIAVSDTGIGIEPRKLDTIFDKFIQADNSITRQYGGTGLGLAITKMLVQIMGGTIEVQSELGKGSTFTVCLPLVVADAEEWGAASQEIQEMIGQAQTRYSPTILLVEDHEPNVLVATHYLEAFGYHFDVAQNGQQALDAIKSKRFNAILMDVQMPGMNGFDVTKLIRSFEQQTNQDPVPIIGMTAHAMAGDRERCLGAGMTDYISKPFNPAVLQETLKAAIGAKPNAGR